MVRVVPERGISQLLATLLLISLTVMAAGIVYVIFQSMIKPYAETVDVMVVNSDIIVTSGSSIVSVTIKNIGTARIDNMVVTVYGEAGRTVVFTFSGVSTGDTVSNAQPAAQAGTFISGKTYAATVVANAGVSTISKTWTIVAH